MPRALLEQARRTLADHDAMLGPADDGGFYLLGLRRCPAGLLAELSWSQTNTCEHTRQRMVARGLDVAAIDRWFDVDRPEDLDRVRTLIDSGELIAAETARVLSLI